MLLLDKTHKITPTPSDTIIPRKASYRSLPFRHDYFVIKHLKTFIEKALKQYLAAGDHVADIGCGEQPFRSNIENISEIYFGIDCCQNSKNTVDLVANIESIPLPGNCYDLILCTEVLEHVSKPITALKEMFRILKPGGKLILTTPFLYPLHEEPNDFFRITTYALDKLIIDNEYKLISKQISGNEIEVIATIWDQILFSINKKYPNLFIRLFVACFRVPTYISATILSFLFDKFLPKKSYLNNFLIIEKPY